MDRKLTFSLFLMAFSLSTFLSIAGVIPVISDYFNVSITMAGLFVALFAFILAITGLILPARFARFERKKFFMATLAIFILSAFLQIFITNFYLALFVRIIPAFFYSSAVSIALTVMSELSPNDVNKVVLGISSGTILGLSISTQIAIDYNYQMVNLWICLINVIALIVIYLYFPRMEGHESNPLTIISSAKSRQFIISVLFISCIGIAISIVYNYFSIILLTLTNINKEIISVYLFANGLASIVGTSLFGHLINRRNNIAILLYPAVFATIVIILNFEIDSSFIVFFLIIIFGMMDGSMHTIAQFWITSSIRKSPEFANGVYLFVNNLNRTLGILIGGMLIDGGMMSLIFIASMSFFLIAIPFVTYRFKKYPHLV